MRNVPLFWPAIFKEEWLNELEKVFSTRWIGQGPKVDEFEKEFGKRFSYEYQISVNSGTAALDLAYHLIDIQPGDEVITPVLTCSATNLPLVRRGANIIFADVERHSLTIDVNDVKKKITPSTKAIVTVNLDGLTCNPEVYALAKEHNIPVIVDAAQSVGIYEEFGDYVVYSFQAIKHFTTFDGGMLILRNEREYERAKKLRWFGIDRDAKKKNNWKCYTDESKREMCMDMDEAGYKFHMNDVAATVGLVGLKHTDELKFHRKTLAEIYFNGISKNLSLVFGGSFWLFGIIAENRQKIMDHLRINGIECDVVHLRNDVFTVFGGKRDDLPNMDWIESRYFYIPIHQNVSFDDAKYIVEKINEVA